MLEWKDKVDGVDDVLAEDINSIANELINTQTDVDNIDKDFSDKASLTEDNTFSNSNTFEQGVVIKGALVAPNDTTVCDLLGKNRLNVYNELAKIEGLESSIGDFEAALDTAIALCDSYINGGAE